MRVSWSPPKPTSGALFPSRPRKCVSPIWGLCRVVRRRWSLQTGRSCGIELRRASSGGEVKADLPDVCAARMAQSTFFFHSRYPTNQGIVAMTNPRHSCDEFFKLCGLPFQALSTRQTTSFANHDADLGGHAKTKGVGDAICEALALLLRGQ